MAQILVPFRGAEGKRRLAPATAEARIALGLAMLADVLSACVAVAPTTLLAGDEAAASVALEVGAVVRADVPVGQAAAVEAALARLDGGPTLVVNADLPCIVPDDVRELLHALPAGGLAVAPAADGTTNALVLAEPGLFRPLYGPGSAERFFALARSLRIPAARVDHPNLADDVDTLGDLRRLESRAGPRTQMALAMAGLAPVA
jgi:2-phospho-L-lactate guanylyltransferase